MDEQAFRELVDPHRAELQVHCYRMVGSMQDAEDLVQETLLAAWRSMDTFEGRASLRSWLYRIATNQSLNALRARSRRPHEVPVMDAPEPTRRIEPSWLEPYPDDPEATYEAKESIELAFIAGLQDMPARQRAALVLRDVLGFRTAEVAEMLGTTSTAVKGALQRARAALRKPPTRPPRPDSARERRLVARFADAVQSGDVDAVVALLTRDARLTMPPQPLEYQGHEAIAAFLRHRAALRGGALRVVPTRANTQPAFGAYLADGRPSGMLVLTLDGDAVSAITWFSDTAVFPRFGLPSQDSPLV
jgi:RNA polymerase sigma-70 factor (TIGR02960 family)